MLNVNVTNNIGFGSDEALTDAILVINENRCVGAGVDPLFANPCIRIDERFQVPQFGALAGVNRIAWNEVSFPIPDSCSADPDNPICNPSISTIRMTNIRANAAQLGVADENNPFPRVKASFSITGEGSLDTQNDLELAVPVQGDGIVGRVVDNEGVGVPGVTIVVSGDSIQGTRTTATDANGRFVAGNLPPGTYEVSAQLEGFHTSKRSVVVQSGETSTAHFQLELPVLSEEILLTAMTNGATNRPATATQSGIAPGSIAVGYGFNVGPDDLFVASSLPLVEGFPGLHTSIQSDTGRHDAFGLYNSSNQFAVVVPSAVNPNFDNFFQMDGLDLSGEVERQSNAYRLNVSPVQPGNFTRNQTGQGEGIFTDCQFNLTTKGKAAMPGDCIIAWGTGRGAALLDDQGVVHDKRESYDDYGRSLGGAIQKDRSTFYVGSAGGFAGGDQVIFELDQNALLGCAVPFYDLVRVGFNFSMSNPVTMPISADGGPCFDSHGLSRESVKKLGDGPLTIGTTRLNELFLTDGESEGDFFVVSLRGSDLNTVSYDPPIPLGTCEVSWLPQGFQSPSAPRPLEFSGDVEITLPRVIIPLGTGSSFGPYEELFTLDDTSVLEDGPYTISTSMNFMVDGQPFSNTWQGNYTRDAGRAKDAVRDPLLNKFKQEGWISPATATDIAASAGVGPEVYMRYQMFVDHGPFGNYEMTCNMPGGASELSGVRDSVQQQSCEMTTHHLPPDPEQVLIAISFFNSDQNEMPQGGALDVTQEVIGAEIGLLVSPQDAARAITDTHAFATCP